MNRALVELSDEQEQALRKISEQTGWSIKELVHEAVGGFIGTQLTVNRVEMLRRARGMWQDRDDLPDVSALRREFDRVNQTK